MSQLFSCYEICGDEIIPGFPLVPGSSWNGLRLPFEIPSNVTQSLRGRFHVASVQERRRTILAHKERAVNNVEDFLLYIDVSTLIFRDAKESENEKLHRGANLHAGKGRLFWDSQKTTIDYDGRAPYTRKESAKRIEIWMTNRQSALLILDLWWKEKVLTFPEGKPLMEKARMDDKVPLG